MKINSISLGIYSIGSSIACAISYYLYKSIFWAFLYSFLGWAYVAYKLIEKYEFFI